MGDKILNSFDVWITAQGLKSKGRLRSVDNISLEGVTRIRELILEFAIKGKLISQHPADESAENLLVRIANEKERLIKSGKLKAENPLPKIKHSEVPFDIPRGWAFARLGEITNKIGSGSTPRGGRESYVNEGVIFLRSQNVWNHGIELTDVAFIDKATHEQMSGTRVLPNDILLNITGGSLGRSTIFPSSLGEANVSQHVTIIRPTDPEIGTFLHLCIISPYGQKLIWGRQVGANREGLSKKVLELFEIPIPPVSEQNLIVAKVNELMALCDELEREETNHLKSHQLLVETLLGTLTNATDANDFQQAWSKLEEHFDDLFTAEESIDQLKKTILQLAVMGKLVPQDPNDEPARELLKRIEKEKLKPFIASKITSNEVKVTLPSGWQFVRLGQVVDLEMGQSPDGSSYNEHGDGVPLINGPVEFGSGPFDLTIKSKFTTSPTKMCKKGDLLVCVRGATTGRTNIAGFDACIGRGVAALMPYFCKDYLNYFMLNSRYSILALGTGTTFPSISKDDILNIVFAMPPINEQKRIVSKIDQLFALCDRLKEKIAEAQKTANQIAEAVLEQIH